MNFIDNMYIHVHTYIHEHKNIISGNIYIHEYNISGNLYIHEYKNILSVVTCIHEYKHIISGNLYCIYIEIHEHYQW